jgi:hypothetical protein
MMDRSQYTGFFAFLLVTLSLFIDPPARRDTVMADSPRDPLTATSPTIGPVFISTVHPVIELDRDLVELVEPVAEAYSFWGVSSVSAVQQTFFPAPLSYPYKFSEKGIQLLKHNLHQIAEVDSTTITERTFPNIPPDHQEYYSDAEKRKFLVEEKYIDFRLKGWDHIIFMKFPTFVVIAVDYSEVILRSVQDYRNVVAEWEEMINQFLKFEDLKAILGVAPKNQEWSNVPLLTFVALSAYSSPDFQELYLSGQGEIIPKTDVTLRFLRDIRLRGFPESAAPNLPIIHCHDIIHEYYFPYRRYYYAPQPVLYPKKYWVGVRENELTVLGDFPLYGASAALMRILRTALFINVTLPSMVEWSKHLNNNLFTWTSTLQNMRSELFNDFTRKTLHSSHQKIIRYTKWSDDIVPVIDSINEVHQGFSLLREDIRHPFNPPMYDPESRTVEENDEDYCLELFHFHRTKAIDDRRKALKYIKELDNNLRSIEISQRRFDNEMSSLRQLLENRRELLKDRDNTLLAIIVPAGGAVAGGLLLLIPWSWLGTMFLKLIDLLRTGNS